MNLKFWEKGFWSQPEKIGGRKKPNSDARYAGQSFVKSFDGEKNLGEIGAPVHYVLEYSRLRTRSWQAFLESDIAQTVLTRYCSWIVDTGLKLDAQPSMDILRSEGIELNAEQFNNVTESRFKAWARSTSSAWNGMLNFNEIAKEAFKNAKIGGDVLVVMRYNKGSVKVQLIDGGNVQSPAGAKAKNNNIFDGVEMDKTGKHVAYHVRTKTFKVERIPAISASTGMVTAFMVYGSKYRIDSHRGFPIIATSLETIAKIDRYKEAAVGSAEERQKIVYQVIHNQFSDGENPLLQGLAEASGLGGDTDDQGLPRDQYGEDLANKVAATTNKEAFNMPIGSEMKSLESKNEMFFKEFYSTNADIICGSIGIPPNVAFSIYNDSFSASRAATKDWEHTMAVERDNFQTQFYQIVYNFWLYTEILTDKIVAPGYLEAKAKSNFMICEAYQAARFTGSMFPHIDPLKEVKAERAKLGVLADHLPLTTLEAATEILGGGNAVANIEQFSEEIKKGNEVDLEDPNQFEDPNQTEQKPPADQ